MTRTTTSTGRSRKGLETATRIGGLLVASSLISGAALAKDERKSKATSDQRSAVAVKTAPSSNAAVKTAPSSRVAVKTAPAGAVAAKTIRPIKGRQP